MASYALTVFFDGGCPLCRREIEHYRKLDARSPIHWIDVTRPEVSLAEFGLDAETAMRRFHVLDDQGHFHVGASGFVTLWTQLPYYRYLAATVKKLCLLPVLNQVYIRFADWHFGRRCSSGSCGLPERDRDA